MHGGADVRYGAADHDVGVRGARVQEGGVDGGEAGVFFFRGTLISLGGEEAFLSTDFRSLFFKLFEFRCILSGDVPPTQRRFW